MAREDDALGELIGTGIVLAGLLAVGAYLERKAAQEEDDRQTATFLLDSLLNEEPGNVLGDSDFGFSFIDPLGADVDEIAALESVIALA